MKCKYCGSLMNLTEESADSAEYRCMNETCNSTVYFEEGYDAEWNYDDSEAVEEIFAERDYFLENSPEDIAEDLDIPFDLSDFDLSTI